MNEKKCRFVVWWNGRKIVFRTPPLKTFERIEKLLMWVHKRKFPDVTSDDQLCKVSEEYKELFEARNELMKYKKSKKLCRNFYREMADVVLSLYGLRRFNEVSALEILYELSLVYEMNFSFNMAVSWMIEKWLEVYFECKYVNNKHVE